MTDPAQEPTSESQPAEGPTEGSPLSSRMRTAMEEQDRMRAEVAMELPRRLAAIRQSETLTMDDVKQHPPGSPERETALQRWCELNLVQNYVADTGSEHTPGPVGVEQDPDDEPRNLLQEALNPHARQMEEIAARFRLARGQE